MNRISLREPLASSSLRQLRDVWLALRDGRQMPSRNDFDPIKIPGLLPQIALTDVFYEPLRFRYRLIGTGITAMSGRDATGRWLDEELYGDKTEKLLWTFRSCVERCEPVAVRQHALFPDRDWAMVEVLLMPMGETDDSINVILSSVVPLKGEADRPMPDTSYLLDWRLGEVDDMHHSS